MKTLVKMAISKHDLDNGLVFNRRQATVWNKYGPGYWRKNALVDLLVLTDSLHHVIVSSYILDLLSAQPDDTLLITPMETANITWKASSSLYK